MLFFHRELDPNGLGVSTGRIQEGRNPAIVLPMQFSKESMWALKLPTSTRSGVAPESVTAAIIISASRYERAQITLRGNRAAVA
jgi:hypothetical protein